MPMHDAHARCHRSFRFDTPTSLQNKRVDNVHAIVRGVEDSCQKYLHCRRHLRPWFQHLQSQLQPEEQETALPLL